jgi:hypothetical protein
VDRLCGLEGVQIDIAMMRTPDGHGRVELTKFRNPDLVGAEPASAPPNTLGSISQRPQSSLRLVWWRQSDSPDAHARSHHPSLAGQSRDVCIQIHPINTLQFQDDMFALKLGNTFA